MTNCELAFALQTAPYFEIRLVRWIYTCMLLYSYILSSLQSFSRRLFLPLLRFYSLVRGVTIGWTHSLFYWASIGLRWIYRQLVYLDLSLETIQYNSIDTGSYGHGTSCQVNHRYRHHPIIQDSNPIRLWIPLAPRRSIVLWLVPASSRLKCGSCGRWIWTRGRKL